MIESSLLSDLFLLQFLAHAGSMQNGDNNNAETSSPNKLINTFLMFIAVGLFGLFAYTYSTTKVNSAEIQSLKNSQYAKTTLSRTSTRSRVSSSSNLLDTQVQGPAHCSLNTEPSKKSTIPDYASGVN